VYRIFAREFSLERRLLNLIERGTISPVVTGSQYQTVVLATKMRSDYHNTMEKFQ
jgi:hypothetical protein